MCKEQTMIINESGLHARPASDFVLKAKTFVSKIKIANLNDAGKEPANAKSIVSILSLGMGKGTKVEVSAEGEDEQDAVRALVELIDSGCGE